MIFSDNALFAYQNKKLKQIANKMKRNNFQKVVESHPSILFERKN